ncbi:PDZ domain-containing protein [Chitinophaga sp. SYP-B3965]|uniref:trypsin-like peptidase domain-containing protein n=1 Tax=Chitinophaga sp. SYP-B3965 TaxID=2663120 RepID=UPI0012997B0A|nr:trypsin-like peptidase domain-containing protein [Chitinophaga sp. SYP-B3965]MRG44378.1 PDZ domain-containing protein [Chitinophaga sp. SYP-B3965]
MKRSRLLVICLTIISANTYGQNIHKAIEKAWPASVRMWGYDTSSKQQMSAQFSAVVVSPQGDILTAAHTSTPGKTYKVMFPDGKVAIALALGKIEMADDPTIPDVSMMKIITPGTWPYAEMGYSSSLKLNQPCISIAYPETLNQHLPGVRFGIITSLGNKRGFLQSTCAMEPGDSGGPLFDELGRVIGIHSAITISESENFEIPVDLYRKYKTALAEAKKFNALPAVEDPIGKDQIQLQTYTPIESNTKNACVLITSMIKGKEEKIYGTAFANAYVVSKSSMVGNEPLINQRKASIIRRDRENDLVLLKIEAPLQDGITLTKAKPDSISFKQLGQFLVSPRLDTANAISVVGTLPFSLPRINSTGFLGASIAIKNGPLLITFIRKNSPAAANDLKVGDEVISINGITFSKAEEFGATLQKYWPNDTITISLKREGTVYTKQIMLDEKPIPTPGHHPAEMFAGGKSYRRDGFTRLFAHDAILTPSQCGGPVFDAAGNFMGINIARFSRTSTLVIPSEVVWAFINIH